MWKKINGQKIQVLFFVHPTKFVQQTWQYANLFISEHLCHSHGEIIVMQITACEIRLIYVFLLLAK